VPPEWLQRVRDASVPRRPSFSRVAFSRRSIVAIAASLLLILTVNFWFVFNRYIVTNEDAVIAEAFAARQDSTRPEQSVAVASIAPEARNQVLTMALSMMLKAPDLSRLGYRLENIRIYADVPWGKAAELAYRDDQNRLFTLYLRHPSSPPRVDLVERDGMRICIWQDDVLSTVMLGEMSAGEMARVASLAYSGLTL
jgi:anti-sigma factor RsiW